MSIADTEEYKDFEMKHNRHLNMLGDSVSLFLFCLFWLNFFKSNFFYLSFFHFETLGS